MPVEFKSRKKQKNGARKMLDLELLEEIARQVDPNGVLSSSVHA